VRRRVAGVALGLVAGLTIAYLAVLGYIAFNQRGLQYVQEGEVTALVDTTLQRTEAIVIPVGTGTEVVNGWFAAPEPGQPLIVYYRGNTGSFSAEHERFETFEAAGYGLLSLDYRGFPMSPGSLSEANVLEDALAAFDFAREQADTLVIWGRSLGSGPATYVASQREADLLILETPFLSAISIAAERYPYLPVNILMQDQYRNDQWIVEVEEPVLVAHGTADTTVPFTSGQRLWDLVPNRVDFLIYDDGTHGDLWDRGLWDDVRPFVAATESGG
jgi:fermentation-respiration switch protein FrsA (DUF1100 family)